MSPAPTPDSEFREGLPFVGGALWIDFLNTTPRMDSGEIVDVIADGAGYGRWLRLAGLQQQENGLDKAAEDARRLRAVLREAFEDLAVDKKAKAAGWLPAVNARLDNLSLHHRLERAGAGLRLLEVPGSAHPDPADLVALDFARFACEAEPGRLKHCANPACTLVFHDSGKNRTRRWCSMSVCGNRDKVARFRAKRAT
ncbi:hypothetical protein HDIA_1854 [Hartmannibacter diazotrophicus]|uniref:Zinc finger CGNR domain-containing protein n=1 Tax=Hartmannibacter diazotrophicus TaxID=1482074 RepID=A0A2C9D789_9HYPH|nr:CGNR zinc finger domain-containing protein [Hartmannibacter diazotrophicus]SON55395.1 hypothetical protein HDIA_1854 [Hartmannibacter diazotrophicus]